MGIPTKVPNFLVDPVPPSASETTTALNSKANSSDLNNYVDLTSTQYITGYKKFKASIVIGEQNNQNDLEFRAANGDRVGFIRGNKLSDDSHDMSINSVDVVNNTTYFNGIILTSKGTAKTIELTQNPDISDNSRQIATTAYVKSNLSDYVTLATMQAITGEKSFSHVIINSDGSWQNGFKFINPKLTTEDAPSSSAFNTINYYGADNIRTGCVENYVSTTNDTFTKLVAIQHSSSASGSCELGVKVLADGTKQTFAPTPATSDNSTQIATTAFVRNVLTSLNPQIEQFGFGQNNSEYSTKPWLYLGQCNIPTQTSIMIFEIYEEMARMETLVKIYILN